MYLKYLLPLYLVFSTIDCTQDPKLLFVQILLRHGERAPIKLYPTDPNPESFWPEGLGKLTKVGKQQMYSIGKYLRSMYQEFGTFSPLEVKVNSSEEDRCQRTALTTLASFFAPPPDWTFDANLNWQPIPVHSFPYKTDQYLSFESNCPRATAEHIKQFLSLKYVAFKLEHEEMLRHVAKHSGLSLISPMDILYLYDTLKNEEAYNMPLPSWMQKIWKEFEPFCYDQYFWFFKSPLILKLRSGPLLGQILDNMKSKIKGDLRDLKFQAYFTHDFTISTLLTALNHSRLRPEYGGGVIFELHETAGQNAVRLLIMNSTRPQDKVEPPRVLLLDGCGEFCPLDHFSKIVHPFVPKNWHSECKIL